MKKTGAAIRANSVATNAEAPNSSSAATVSAIRRTRSIRGGVVSTGADAVNRSNSDQW